MKMTPRINLIILVWFWRFAGIWWRF